MEQNEQQAGVEEVSEVPMYVVTIKVRIETEEDLSEFTTSELNRKLDERLSGYEYKIDRVEGTSWEEEF